MSRHIPKHLNDSAPCCKHCSSDDYYQIHHIVPYKIIECCIEYANVRDSKKPRKDKLIDAHTNNIIKLCKECHDEWQLSIPKRIADHPYENSLRCYVCGEWTCTHKYNIFGKDVYFCQMCTKNWLYATKWYIEWHHKGYERRKDKKLLFLISEIKNEINKCR